MDSEYGDFNTLSNNMDELSLNKQLPFRQQASKPLLKYSSSEPGPIYLYSNGDAVKRSVSGSSVPASPVRSSSTNHSTYDANNNLTSAKRNGQQPQYTFVHMDPYARPLSAKDLLTVGMDRTKPMPTSQSKKTSIMNGLHATNMANSNIFKSSQSEVSPSSLRMSKTEQSFRNTGKTVIDASSVTPQATTTTLTTTKVISVATSSNTTMQTSREKFEASLSKPPLPTTQIHSDKGARPPSALRRPVSSKIRNPNYTPSKPYHDVLYGDGAGDDTEFKMVSDSAKRTRQQPDTLNGRISEAIFNLNRSKTSDVSTHALHSQSDGKPKSAVSTSEEVKSATSVTNIKSSSYSSLTSLAPNNSATLPTTQNASSVSTPPSATPTANEVPRPVGKIASNSRQSSSSTSSIVTGVTAEDETPIIRPSSTRSNSAYYLKSCKPEVKIAELRPACEGKDNSRSGSTERRLSAAAARLASATTTTGAAEAAEDEGDEGDEDESSNSNLSERMPGDGEAFDDFEDDDDMIDDLDDDELEGPDDDSDSYSNASGSRSSVRARSASAGRSVKCIDPNAPLRMKSARRRTHSSYADHNTQPALIKSLFPNVPPYLNFITENEKLEQLPWEFRRLLKWRMCAITPNVVKNCIARSGFRATKKHHDWLGCWGRHMKAQGFKSIREYQKLNHFPGSFQIGRKDRLWRNLSKLQVSHGKREFGFFPTTYVLPFDMKGLKRAWEDGGGKLKWIIKPPASARGIGIKVINKWNQIPKKRAVIVQKYIAKPLLINGAKFDCRIYVYVTSYDPLRIYVYEDGLVRFCSTKYSHSMKDINNKYMHLTNYSVQKKSGEYESNQDDAMCQGHKWSLKALWGYLLKKGVNTNEIWKNIKDLIVKTIISSESSINSYIKANVRSRYSVHELFGFDVLLDETYKPWVLEVNISPSLHSNSQLDINIKGGMIKDLHNLAGFRIPDKHDVVPNPPADSYKPTVPSNRYCMDKRLHPQTLSSDEKAKHAYYSQRYQDTAVLGTITDVLTPDDLRILVESIDEDSRKGGFQRVFPTPTTNRYLVYFESQRYYNLFLDQWCQKYNRIEARGIALVEAACRNRIHLQNPTDDGRHQWYPPTSRISLNFSSTSLSSTTTNGILKLRKSPKKNDSGRPPLPSPVTSSSAASIVKPVAAS